MAQKNNLTIQVLSIIGGVLTAFFFLGFLSLAAILRSESSCLIVGGILIITTLAVNRMLTKPFLDAMNITCFIAGCVLAGFGMSSNLDVLFITLLGISIVTLLVSRGFILPFLSVIVFYTAFFGEITNLFSLRYPLQVAVVPVMAVFLLVNLFETKILSRLHGKPAKYQPLHSGLFVSCIASVAWLSINFVTNGADDWILSVFMWAGVLMMVYKIMHVMQVKKRMHQVCIYLLCIVICLPTLFAPYLSGSLLLILICFQYGYKTECGAALVLFIYSISKYYYDLDITLLTKSITLFFTGIALILAWYIFTQKKTRHEKI